MKIKELSALKDKEYWISKINESDWGGGKFLAELLESGDFYRLCGSSSKIFLLCDNEDLISFCSYAEKDDIQDTDLAPWIGFVYTFPNFRGKRRIGKLFEHIYGLAKQDGHNVIYISTDQPGLYENFGCSFFRQMKDFRGDDSHVYKLPVENKDYSSILGKTVKGKIDRPLGTAHPRHPEIIYPLNYGFVSGIFAADGDEQDVYIFGTDKPLSVFEGKVIAVWHRINDFEDKWIVSLDDKTYTNEELLEKISFQEQYFMGELYR